jgi:hypothetical protein
MFSLSVPMDNVFGLGNGGYHVYVDEQNDYLVATYGSESMISRQQFWAAPESDLVYFIASWGVLSVVFFAFFLYLIVKSGAILAKSENISLLDRLALYMMLFIIFSGISQDNAGDLVWWVFLACGYGVVIKNNRVSRMMRGRSSEGVVNNSLGHV